MKKTLLTTLLVTSLTVLTIGCKEKDNNEASQQASAIKVNHAPQAFIEKMSQGRLSVLETFSGPSNLQGVVVQSQGGGQPMIMYVDSKDQFAFYGAILGADGQNLAEQDKNKYITPLLAKKIAENLPLTTQFKQGSESAPYKMIVLADPNCSACHAFYNVAKSAVDSGKLQISWILVYFVQKDSEAKAAAILSAPNPTTALAENEANFDSSTEEGGIQALQDIPQELKQKLDANMKFMQNSGIASTPTLIFYNENGDLTYISGSPSNIEDFLKKNNPQIIAPTAK